MCVLDDIAPEFIVSTGLIDYTEREQSFEFVFRPEHPGLLEALPNHSLAGTFDHT